MTSAPTHKPRKRAYTAGRILAVLFIAAVLSACAQQVGDIDRTQPDRIQKSQLDGHWHVRHTIVEVPPSASFTVAGSQNITEEIVWEIQENYLIGRRAHAFRAGSEEGRQTSFVEGPDGELMPVFEGAVVVAYRIKGHFDIQRQYNPSTGEQTNVIVENYSDRPWNEREYMRVDWGRNVATDFFFLDDAALSSIEYFVSEVDVDNPDRPLMLDDYMEITGRAAVRPDVTQFWFGSYPNCFLDLGTDCRENIIKTRTSFMKRTSDRDMYVARQWDQTDRAKFQILDWWRPSHDDDFGHAPNETLKWTPRLYNIFDDMTKAPEERQIRPIIFYVNANWPTDDEGLMWATRKSFEDWNVAFKEVVRNAGYAGPDVDVVVLCENNPVKATDPEVCRTRVIHEENPDGTFKRVEQDIFDITHNGHISWGDLRFNQLNMIMEPQNYGSVLAFAQGAWNAENGEVMSTSTHVLWTTMESYTNRVADFVQLMSGDLPVEEYISGEYTRQRIRAAQAAAGEAPAVDRGLDRKLSPLMVDVEPRRELEPSAARIDPAFVDSMRRDLGQKLSQNGDLSRIRERVARKIERQRDQGGAAVQAQRIERMRPMLDEAGEMMRAELMAETEAWPAEFRPPVESIDAMVPLMGDLHARREATDFERHDHASRHMLSGDNLFNIGQVSYYKPLVERFRGKSRQELEDYLRPVLYYYTIAHELGHNLGLEHNFAGSSDALNFAAEYWLERVRAGFVPDYLIEDKELLAELDNNQLLRSSQYTSIMDYLPYDFLRDDQGRMRSGVGSADLAAVNYAYADSVQIFDPTAVPESYTWVDDKGNAHTIDVDRSLIEFDPQVASKVNEFHYSHLLNMALKPEHHVRVCMSPLGHLCDEELTGVDFNDPDADGIYVGDQKMTTDNADDLGQKLFSAAVALSEGRRWVKTSEVTSDNLLEVPYRTCENSLNRRVYHCEMHDFGADLWERTRNVSEGADFYYFISHFSRDNRGAYTPTYYAWTAAERELVPLMRYVKHFINRGLIEEQQHMDLWYADPAGGLNALMASFMALDHWKGFMAAPTMNSDRADRLRFRRDPATGELESEPMPASEPTGAADPVLEHAVYQLDRSDMLLKPVDRFNTNNLDKSVTLTFEPSQARYLRSEYDPDLGYDYFWRPVVYGNWISKLIAVEVAADPSTRFVGTDSGADTSYALNLATIFDDQVWSTLAGFFSETPGNYTQGVSMDGEQPELMPLRSALDESVSRFPGPVYEAYIEPDESFTARLYATLYSTMLFDLSADNPFGEASNAQILGEDREIPEGAVEGEDYLLVPDMSNERTFIIFKHHRTGGLFQQRELASPSWDMALRILDIYERFGFHDDASYREALSAARSAADNGTEADNIEDDFEDARNFVEDDLQKLNLLRTLTVRYGASHPSF